MPFRMNLRHATGVAALSLVLVSFCWHVSFSRGGHNNQSQRAGYPTTGGEQALVRAAIERITLELGRGYLISKGTHLPASIDSIADLEVFLNRLYPDKNHELRMAVANLRVYGDGFAGSKDPELVGNYLREGIKRYAVNLKGQPLAYDKAEVARTIEQTSNEVMIRHPKPPQTEKEEPVVIRAKSSTRLDTVTSFIRLHSLPFVAGLLTSNLISLFVIFRMRSRRAKKTKSNPIKSVSDRRTQAAKGDNVRIKVINPDDANRPDEPVPVRPKSEIVPVIEADSPPQILAVDSGVTCGDWLVVRASVQGKLHVESEPPIPCQDSSTHRDLGSGWGIGVVCDGAGSKKFSHYGSRFVADLTAMKFEAAVDANGWARDGRLPADNDWQDISKTIFTDVRAELDAFARNQHSIDISLLSCTVIVLVHSPFGILASHIGDGRAAFANESDEWKPVMKPHKGEEANQTVFVTSIDGSEPRDYIESRVFREKPAAFTLMSDGCEAHSFEVNIFDEGQGKYTDPNKPYEKFFQPLVSKLKDLYRSKAIPEEIDQKWVQFITAGNEKLRNEPDDKTMILGVLVR